MSHRLPHMVTALLACALAAPWAQADCVDGTREPSAAELEFHRRASAALAAALPMPPAGAQVEGQRNNFESKPTIGVLCREQKLGDFKIEVSRRYVLPLSEAESRRLYALRKEIDDRELALLKLPPEVVAEREALSKKVQAAEVLRVAAVRAGDTATANARMAEIDRYNGMDQDLVKRHQAAVKPQTDALKAQRKAYEVEDQHASIGLAINRVKLPSPGANPVGSYGSDSPAGNASLKVVNVVWGVGGPDTPLRKALVEALDRPGLQALVGKPLPAFEESQAKAEAAAAATAPVATAPPSAAAGPLPTATATATATTTGTAPPAAVVAPPAVATSQPGGAAATSPDNAAPKAAEVVNKATDGLNRLRGLLGR
jgi:hypothetical protein